MKLITKTTLNLLILSTPFVAYAETLTIESDLDVVGDVSLSGELTVGGETVLNTGNLNTTLGLNTGDSVVTTDSNGSTNFGNSLVSGTNSVAWGYGVSALGNGSTAWGVLTYAFGNFSTAWGSSRAGSILSTTFGRYNINSVHSSDSDENWYFQDSILEIGIGTDPLINQANAITILKDGRTALGKHVSMTELRSQEETLQVQGPLVIQDYKNGFDANGKPLDANGNSVDSTEGAIRYTGTDFEGYKNATDGWVSFTAASSGSSGPATTLVSSDDNTQTAIAVTGADSTTLSTTITGKVVLATAQGDISMGAFGAL